MAIFTVERSRITVSDVFAGTSIEWVTSPNILALVSCHLGVSTQCSIPIFLPGSLAEIFIKNSVFPSGSTSLTSAPLVSLINQI